MTEPTPGLHPAQNRALRECYAFTRQLAEHWRALGGRLWRTVRRVRGGRRAAIA